MERGSTAEVTVLMTVYNAMPFLTEAVDSILRQSFSDFTFLIIDDGSTDGGAEFLDQLADPRIRVVHQANSGQGTARNIGLRMCRGEFVAMMDADDVAMPSRLESQIKFLKCHREVGVVGSQFAYLGTQGKVGFKPPMPVGHAEIFSNLLHGRLAMCQASLTCRSSVLRKIGGYRFAGCGEDWDMFLRMGEASRLANLSEVLYLYRIHPSCTTIKHARLVQARTAHACACANRRMAGLPEPSFEDFCAERRARPLLQRVLDRMDCYSFGHYRVGVGYVLDARPIMGYARIAWAAICSPMRTCHRIHRVSRRTLRRVACAPWAPHT